MTLPTGDQGPVEWTAMSCTATDCVAVGGVPVTPGETLQAASITLSRSPTVLLAGVVGQFLGVDCDATRCEAVGNQAVSPDSANYKALAGLVPR